MGEVIRVCLVPLRYWACSRVHEEGKRHREQGSGYHSNGDGDRAAENAGQFVFDFGQSVFGCWDQASMRRLTGDGVQINAPWIQSRKMFYPLFYGVARVVSPQPSKNARLNDQIVEVYDNIF